MLTAAILTLIVRAFGQRIISINGFILSFVTATFLLLAPALAVEFTVGNWSAAPVAQWVVVALFWGGISAFSNIMLMRAADDYLALHGALSNESNLRHLIAWDLKWFSYPIISTLAMFFLITVGLAYRGMQDLIGPFSLPVGTLIMGAIITYVMGETLAALVLQAAEHTVLARGTFQLFRPNPAQTLALRRSLRGNRQFAMLASLYLTGVILITAVLLPPAFIIPSVLALLVLTYSTILLILLAPRMLISTIVRRTKEQDLVLFQNQLNALWEKAPHLTPEEYQSLKRLKEMHDGLFVTPENLLNIWGIFPKILGPLLLPTLASLLTTLMQSTILQQP